MRVELDTRPITPRTLAEAFSVEVVVYLGILAAALLLRLVGLSARPLSENEAAIANAAWQFLQGSPNGFVGSPLIFSTNLLLFFLGGPTDATVRILPAFVGSGLVLLPLLIRREIGRAGAMVSSILILLSTSLVYFSRQSVGAEISVALGLAAAVCLWRYREVRRPSYLYWGAAAAALALNASSIAFTIVLAAGIFTAIFRLLEAREVHERVFARELSEGPAPAGLRVDGRKAVILFLAMYVGIATAFLSNREGLGAAFELFGSWLGGFSSFGSFASPLNLLPIYEPVALVFGFAGLLLLASLKGEELRRRGILLFFAIVLVLGVIIYSFSGSKSPENVVVLVVPLAILGGWLIGSLIERFVLDIQSAGGWRAALFGEFPILGAALALTALIYLQLVNLLQQDRFSPNIESLREFLSPGGAPGEFETALVLLGIFAVAIGSLIVLLAIGTLGTTRAANLGSMLIVFLLGLSGVHALWLANYASPEPVNELIGGQQTSLQVRDLVSDLKWLSEWKLSDPYVIPIRAEENLGAVVHWYLRGFKNVQWVRQPQADALDEAILTSADAAPPAGTWIDQRYRIEAQWSPANLTGDLFWKWLLFRDGGAQDWLYVKMWAPKPG